MVRFGRVERRWGLGVVLSAPGLCGMGLLKDLVLLGIWLSRILYGLWGKIFDQVWPPRGLGSAAASVWDPCVCVLCVCVCV